MRLAAAGLAVCVAGLAFAGCGTGADKRAARSVAERFYAAVQHHDGQAACSLLGSEPPGCASQVTKLKLRGSRVSSVSVYATSAQARFDSGDVVFLGFTHDGWKIDAVGCRPNPSGGPMNCEQES
jgi:hypothetical protein